MRAKYWVVSVLLSVSISGAAAKDEIWCKIDGQIATTEKRCDELRAAREARAQARKLPHSIVVPANKRSKGAVIAQRSPILAAVTSPKPEVQLFLRKSFEDLKSLSEPSALADATGATASWTHDRVADNKTWSLQALIGFSVKTQGTPLPSAYLGETFTGAYVAVDRQENSRDKAKNIDVMTFGGRHEVVIANWLSTNHYIGLAGEVVTDVQGVAKNWNFTADYQPFGTMPDVGPRPWISYANDTLDNIIPYMFVTFSPKLRAEYRGSIDGSEDPLFLYHKNVFRIGGSMGMTIRPSTFYSGKEMPWLTARSLFSISYGWLYDIMSSRNFDYLDTSYTIHLTESKNVGLTFSYRHGLLDATAQKVDLYKVALSAKFDYDPVAPRE